MITNPTSSGPTINQTQTSIEEAVDLSIQIRETLNDGFNQLRDLSLKLKQINREQKASAREFNSVRSTLRSIQGLKL